MSVQTEDTEGQEALPIVGYSAEELEFKVKSSWISVEQPPKAAGQVRQQADREQQAEQGVSQRLPVVSRRRSRRWQVQRLLRVRGAMMLLLLTQRPTVAI